MSTKRVVVYVRLSITTDESVSIERQLEACRNYCKARGWTIVAEHKDDGVSASASAPEHRRGWQEVLAHPKGTYDVVLVWKIDRLARRVLDFLNADKALQERGAAVAAVEDPVDMSTAQGRAFATMLAVFAEMEAEAIRVRVKAAREALIKAGRVPGGAAPFGYWNAPIVDSDGNEVGGKVLAKDPETIGVLTEAIARVMRGDSINSVATYLDEAAPRTGRKNSAAHWTITVTKRMLANPIHAGMTPYNPGNKGKQRGSEVLRDTDGMPIIREDLAILSVEEYRSLLERLEAKEPRKAPTESYLSGLVMCGDCNRPMYRNAKVIRGERIRVFQCQGKEGCGQQVSRLEEIVERRFLAEFGSTTIRSVKPVATDQLAASDITNQINDTLARMQEEDADVLHLAERLQTLRALRRNVPDVEYVIEESQQTYADRWAIDPRAALLTRWDGVRVSKGKVGRNFDQNRLSWIRPKNDPERNRQFFATEAGKATIAHMKQGHMKQGSE